MATGGCSFGPVDLDGRACPCADGWVCVDAQCVLAEPDAGRDAAVDVGRDAGDDAAPRDVGVDVGPDAGPSDAGFDTPDVGPRSVCEDTASFFCSDFEDGSLSPPWTRSIVDVDVGSVENTTARAAQGERSMHAIVTESSSRARMQYEFEEDRPEVHARAQVYIPTDSPHDFVSLLLLGQGSTTGIPVVALQMRESDQASIYAAGARVPDTTLVIPRDRWVCIGLTVVSDGADDLHVIGTVGAEPFYDQHVSGTAITALDFAMAGIEFSGPAGTGTEVFVDDVEFSETPLPCAAE